MPTTDEELQHLHDNSVGQNKELYAELIQARKALPLAKKLSQLGPIVETHVYGMELQGCPRDELHMAIVHKKADGSGRVGPMWDLGEFGTDLDKLAKILSTEDEVMELKAAGIVSMFGAGNIKSTPVG
jgi:hypothetical protein